MKHLLLLILLTSFLSCKKDAVKTFSTVDVSRENINGKVDWQEGFGLTHNPKTDSIWGKPVSFYLDHVNCDSRAKEFYFGKYRPTDEAETQRLLNLVTTENDSLRPFYRWILNKTILIQDGALAEYTGVHASRYAEKYPKEFFEYMDYDKSSEKYSNWVNSIFYSGFYDFDDYKNSEKIKSQLMKEMKKNCFECNPYQLKRIEKFAEDCFPK